MSEATILTFCAVAAVLTVTPGADTLLVLRNAMRGGWRDGMATMVGISSGLIVHACLSALGLSVLLQRSAEAYRVVQWAGAAYLIWLGIDSWRRSRHIRDGEWTAPWSETPARPVSPSQSLGAGFLTNLLNPKVALFYLALLPQFVGPGEGALPRSLFLVSIHIGMGVLWLGGLSLTVHASRRWVRRGSVRRWMERVSGSLLIALGARLALDRGPGSP